MSDIKAFCKRVSKLAKRYRTLIRLVLIVLGIIGGIFYLKAFFTKGVVYENEFLTRKNDGAAVIYTGEDRYGKIQLTVHQRSKTEIDISYLVPYNKLKTYTLVLNEISNSNPEVTPWYRLRITAGNGSILFDGKYQRGNPFLYTNNNLPDNSDIASGSSGSNPYQNFSPNLRRMVGIATGEYDRLLGNAWYFLLGLAFIGLVCFDAYKPVVSDKIREAVIDGEYQRSEWDGLVLFSVRLIFVIVGICFLMGAI